MWNNIINFGGYLILIILLILSFAGIAESQGGWDAVVGNATTNQTYAESLIWYEISRDFIVPLYPIENVPVFGTVYFPIDDWSPLFMLAITAFISFVIWKWKHPGLLMIPIILLIFIIVSWVWTGFWISNIYAHGSVIGMTNEEILADIMGTTQLFEDSPFILPLGLGSMFFVLWKGGRLIKR